MRDNLIALAGTIVTLLVLDFAWLSLMMGPLYKRMLGPLLADPVSYPPVVVFYLIYAAGTVFFAVRPALDSGNWSEALLRGAVLGFLAYATYDLTNLATLKVWSLRVALMDIAWGTILTGAAASAGAILALRLER